MERQPTLPALPHFVSALAVIEEVAPTDSAVEPALDAAAAPDVAEAAPVAPVAPVAPSAPEAILEAPVAEIEPVVELAEPIAKSVVPEESAASEPTAKSPRPKRSLSRSKPDASKKTAGGLTLPRPSRNTIVNGVILILLAGVGYGVWTSGVLSNEVLVTGLEDGQCVQDFFSGSQTQFQSAFVVETTSCDDPHAYEVFSTSETIFDSASYPGVEAAFETAQGYCAEQYNEVIGGDFASSQWNVWTFAPTEARWDAGERVVQCLVGDFEESELIVGSLRGTES